MAQMYKVFIQNRPLIFKTVEKNEKNNGNVYLESEIKKVKKLVFTSNPSDSDHTPIIIICEDAQKTFNLFFKKFDFVEAAGGIVRRKKKFLFIKRNGFWDIPKGKIDEGENPLEAALREIEEECGITCKIVEHLICNTYHTYNYKGKPTLKKTDWYSISYSGPKTVKPQAEEGITKVKWYKTEKFKKIRKNTFASIIEVLDQFEHQVSLTK